MKLLVTGGSGMVGRNVREHPRARDVELVAPTRAELDLLDARATERFLQEVRPDAVVHCAGRVGGIQANVAAPAAFLTENLLMGTNLVTAARKARVPRLLNLGSSCMYPKDSARHLTEEMLLTGPLEETNEGYALAKIAVARLCEYVSREDPELAYRTLVPCNLFGRHDSFDPRDSHMLPAAIRKVHEAAATGSEVEIWGDGEARREFMYAGDLADCVFFALERYDDLPPLLNVGIGDDRTVNEYYALTAEALGVEVRFRHDLSKPTGMRRKVLDVTRARDLGWEPATSTLEGIRRTHEYFLSLRG